MYIRRQEWIRRFYTKSIKAGIFPLRAFRFKVGKDGVLFQMRVVPEPELFHPLFSLALYWRFNLKLSQRQTIGW